jgi:deferrochelatase/peroxidase EfeB
MGDSASKIELKLPLPEPPFARPYQNGITDPMWSEEFPESIDPKERARYLKEQVAEGRLNNEPNDATDQNSPNELYQAEYAGRVARQEFQSIMRIDVCARSREEFVEVLKRISAVVLDETLKKASVAHLRPFDPIPDSYRVTITIGFGASLFVDSTGFDRYDIAARKPKFLKTMPSFQGDSSDFKPEQSASDLILVISSDHTYVNVAIVRYIAEFFNKDFSRERHEERDAYDVLKFRGVEEGFGRMDKREFLRFDDGVENLQIDPAELRRLVYVDATDNEPRWCVNGTYLVYRKVRENMPRWEQVDDRRDARQLRELVQRQERMIGRHKESSLPLGQTNLTPVFPDPTDASKCPLDAHIRKVQPRRPTPDLFGLNDLERRFLRRPYPFFDGLGADGQARNGLQFLAFMKNVQQQFEHVVNMWQMNPDFPVAGTGVDAMYANGILSTTDGGYYFCPPGLKHNADFFGSGMFA